MRLDFIVWEKEVGLTAKEISKKIGITETTYSLIKNGKVDPSLKTIDKFMKAFPNIDMLKLLKKY